MAQKHLYGYQGGEMSCLVFIDLIFLARHSAEGEIFSPIQLSSNSEIGLIIPGNVAMVAIDLYGKSPMWE